MSNEPQTPSKELLELIESVIDGAASPEQKQSLAAALQASPETRQLYVQHCEMHAALAWHHGVLDQLSFPLEDESAARNPFIRLVSTAPAQGLIKGFAIAACIALISVFAYQSLMPTLESNAWLATKSVGSIDRYAGGQLVVTDKNITLKQGDDLRVGSYTLAEGLAAFTLANNVEVLLEAPAQFQLTSGSLLLLQEGKLSAHVPPEGIGFTVETPHAQIVDHGTDFGVEVSKDQQSEVHVFKGEVEVTARSSLPDDETLRLTSSQATRVSHGSMAPFGIEIDPERFLRTLEEPSLKYFKQIKQSYPIAYYRMGISDDGTTLTDKADTENPQDGFIHRETKQGSPFTSGKFGAALNFKGGADRTYAVVENCPASSKQTFTVTAWALAHSRGRSASIAKTKEGNGGGQFHIGLLDDQGGIEARVSQSDNATLQLSDPTPIPLETWQHIALVVDGQTARLYRNGIVVDEAPNATVKQMPSQMLTIGAFLAPRKDGKGYDPIRFWHGKIDEIAIHDIALSAQEIQELAAKERSAEPSSLTSNL